MIFDVDGWVVAVTVLVAVKRKVHLIQAMEAQLVPVHHHQQRYYYCHPTPQIRYYFQIHHYFLYLLLRNPNRHLHQIHYRYFHFVKMQH